MIKTETKNHIGREREREKREEREGEEREGRERRERERITTKMSNT